MAGPVAGPAPAWTSAAVTSVALTPCPALGVSCGVEARASGGVRSRLDFFW